VQEEKTHREVEQAQARHRRRSAFKYKAEVIYEYKSEDSQRECLLRLSFLGNYFVTNMNFRLIN